MSNIFILKKLEERDYVTQKTSLMFFRLLHYIHYGAFQFLITMELSHNLHVFDRYHQHHWTLLSPIIFFIV